jgi:hypothetical protein
MTRVTPREPVIFAKKPLAKQTMKYKQELIRPDN